jgi:hypothetical protein
MHARDTSWISSWKFSSLDVGLSGIRGMDIFLETLHPLSQHAPPILNLSVTPIFIGLDLV